LENEYAWKRLSSTLESDYKIYGYRVDAIHSITYGILHAMARRQQDP
jgi:1,4-alpha-glucan branching enzyme